MAGGRSGDRGAQAGATDGGRRGSAGLVSFSMGPGTAGEGGGLLCAGGEQSAGAGGDGVFCGQGGPDPDGCGRDAGGWTLTGI